MQTLKRSVVAVLAIAGAVHAAQPQATDRSDPVPALHRVDRPSTALAPVPTSDTARMTVPALEERVQTLERELARLRPLEDAQARLPVQPDPAFYW